MRYLNFFSTIFDTNIFAKLKIEKVFLKKVQKMLETDISMFKDVFGLCDPIIMQYHSHKEIKNKIGAFMKKEKIEIFEDFHEFFCLEVKTL